ncbi:MAG: sortase, partial [Chloroflexota bacterium]
LTDGEGSCTLTSDIPDGALITAAYNGSDLYHSASSTKTHDVIMEDTLTTISSSLPNPSANGEDVFFTVKVETASTHTLDVPGTVDIKEGTDTLCSGSTVFGVITCSTSSLENGSHTIYAVYSGQANNFNSSESDSIEQVVGQISLDDNKTSTSFTTVGDFSTISGTAPYTYSLQDDLRLCTADTSADNGLFEISNSSLLRKEDTPAGEYRVCVQSQDAEGGIIVEPFSIIINDPPLLTEDSLSNKNMDINHELIGTITAEAGQPALVYSLQDSGPVCNEGNASGNKYFTIDDTALMRADSTPVGSYDICVQVSDGEEEISQYAYTINITNPPSALDLTRKTVSTLQDVVGTWIVTDGQTPLTLSLSTSGSFCNESRGEDNDLFRIKNNKLERLSDTAAGEYSICAQVFDSNNAAFQAQFTIYVTDPPTGVTLSNNTITVNQQIVGTLDTESGQFIYHYQLNDSGSECNSDNARDNALFNITGNALERLGTTPPGSYAVCIQSTDANDEITQTSFSITVTSETLITGKLTASLTANQLIDGDTSGTVAGSLVSSIPETVFSLVDLDKFPLAKFFDISVDNRLLVNTTVDITRTPFFPIRILAAAPKGEKQYIDAVISVMKNGSENDSSAIDDYGQVETYKTVEIDILSNDRLSKGASYWVSHQIVNAPLHGKAVIGSIIYTPDKNYKGSDVITYRACDNLNYCVIGNVLITVLQAGTMPDTGFAPGIVTLLPKQPEDSLYTSAGNLELSIPAIGTKSRIVGIPATNDGWNLAWLGNDTGWLAGSAYPTWNGNSVLTGHVFNADGKPGIFASLGLLRWGDEVTITLDGVKYTYEVREVLKSVSPYALNTMLKHKDTPWLTLVTCDSYDKTTNTYRTRTLVRAILVHTGN